MAYCADLFVLVYTGIDSLVHRQPYVTLTIMGKFTRWYSVTKPNKAMCIFYVIYFTYKQSAENDLYQLQQLIFKRRRECNLFGRWKLRSPFVFAGGSDEISTEINDHYKRFDGVLGRILPIWRYDKYF